MQEHNRACPWDWPSWDLPGEVGSLLSSSLRGAKTLSPSVLQNGHWDRFMFFWWRQTMLLMKDFLIPPQEERGQLDKTLLRMSVPVVEP